MSSVSLQQTLKTEQTLSPQMLQSLALLPMPLTELNQFIQKEIESNPALEIPESTETSYDPEASDRKQQMIENTAADGESLSEHLMVQLVESPLDKNCREIGELLIGNLDANGFFIVPLSELFEGKFFSEEEINKTIETVQSFDPYGICVPDFKASLVLQAKLSGCKGKDLQIMTELINNRLDQLKNGKFNDIALSLGISVQDVEAYYSVIKSLTPFPGRSYESNAEAYVVPEFSVHEVDGQLELKMNRANLPDLEISPEFSALSDGLSGTDAKEANNYIKNSIRQAKTLISQVNLG